MNQSENIETLERRLWASADSLRANSNYASNEYFLPVMGLIFLCQAHTRYLAVKPEIEATLPSRAGQVRPLCKEDFSRKSAIFLRPEAHFDHLVELTDSDDRAQVIIDAMEAIEVDYSTLKGVLPKSEYQELDNSVLGTLLRIFNDPMLKAAKGDVFGRIYEYFLTKFADQKAHDGGEFFTPVSLVQMIANIIEPDHGNVIDPACGSGGMFVQSAHFIEHKCKNPQDAVTFYGMEKNPTTIRLAKMNLAVHGLEGDIRRAISYYEDPHSFLGCADYVMANPPFNVDDVDAEKIKGDARLLFGLPGVNKKGAVSNGNYLWISYFYSYLNEKGHAGFVMSSQASSAGGGEEEIRRKLVESGDVDVMIAIRGNFFYTRSVPCELWFFNRAKPKHLKDKILMLDARNVYRKVTRKICDFSPEQFKNLTAIVWLYRGQSQRFLALVESYLKIVMDKAKTTVEPINAFLSALDDLLGELGQPDEKIWLLTDVFKKDNQAFCNAITEAETEWNQSDKDNNSLKYSAESFLALVETSRSLVNQIENLYKFSEKLAKDSGVRGVNKLVKVFDGQRKGAVDHLKQIRYAHRQARWLQERFPDAELCDIEGLVKLVNHTEIKANDWSLTPGRYVGVAPEEEDEDFEEKLRDLHIELRDLNKEANLLVAQIQENFQQLDV